jgi:hypothetical protein
VLNDMSGDDHETSRELAPLGAFPTGRLSWQELGRD